MKPRLISVVEPGSGLSILICPSGEKHQAVIASVARSTPSAKTGNWDISTHSTSGDVFKSGIISGGKLSLSGNFCSHG